MHWIKRFRDWYKRPNKSWLEQIIESIIVVVPIAFIIRTYMYGLYQVPSGSMETTMLVGERFVADKFSILFWNLKRGDIISFNDPKFPYSDNYFINMYQRYVWGPSNWTKRVIGLPGEHVKGVIEDGKPVVYVNGNKLDEPYLNKYPLIGVHLPDCGQRFFTHFSYDENYSYAEQPFYRMKELNVLQGKRLAELFDVSWMLLPQTPLIEKGINKDEFDIYLGPDEYWAMGDNRLGSYDSRGWGPLKAQLIHGKIVFRLFSIDSQESWLILDILKHPIEFWSRVRWSRFFQIVS